MEAVPGIDVVVSACEESFVVHFVCKMLPFLVPLALMMIQKKMEHMDGVT